VQFSVSNLNSKIEKTAQQCPTLGAVDLIKVKFIETLFTAITLALHIMFLALCYHLITDLIRHLEDHWERKDLLERLEASRTTILRTCAYLDSLTSLPHEATP